MEISQVKISEIARITKTSVPLISRHFKNFEFPEVHRVKHRILGVSPETTEEYLRRVGYDFFYQPTILLSANLCGGVGKTSTILNLGAALRRITNRETAIVYVDGDSQGSFTSSVFGKPAEDDEPILIDFLEERANIDQILVEVKDNIWFVKSNLNQAFIDKVLAKPKDMKSKMLRFYNAIFEKLGPNTKILQDHTPQLSSLFSSSICALSQLDNSIKKIVLIPIRSDKFAIQGAEYIIKEIYDLIEVFSLERNIDIHCFFSSIDKRVSTTAEAIKITSSKASIVKHLSSVVIRYCAEIPKAIMQTKNVYSLRKNNNAAEDYQDLLQYVLNHQD